MRKNCIDRFLVTLHDIKSTVGQTCLLKQLRQQQRRRWIALRWFKHKGVAAHEGQREHPHRNHRREIERCDAGYDAQRLPQRIVIDATADVVRELRFQQLRCAAGEFDDLDAALNLAFRIAEHLAVLIGDN